MDQADNKLARIREAVIAEASQSTGMFSERDFARRFGLTRYVTKKILIALENEGLIRCLPQRGYQIVDYTHTNDFTMQKMRCVVEADAVRAAAKNATREDLVRLTLIVGDMRAAIVKEDVATFRNLDFEFHRALVTASHDPMFAKLFDMLLAMRYTALQSIPGLLEMSQQDHENILQAVVEHDPAKAEIAMYRHLGRSLWAELQILSGLQDDFAKREVIETECIMRETVTNEADEPQGGAVSAARVAVPNS